jgi:phospholipase/carboxylesterase
MNTDGDEQRGPHDGQPLLLVGEPLERAHAAAVMLHGRGAAAADILALAPELRVPGFAFVAPQAAGNTWYPYSFLAPLASNEPWLTSALKAVGGALARVTAAGIPPERTLLLGFSQGACLTLEYVARNAQRYGGVAGLSGGLIGPDQTPRDYAGSLSGTPVFLGCSDVDPHIPASRVEESAEVLRRLGGDVTARLYADMEHTINEDELDAVRSMMRLL